jgi:hypothetical protein
MGSAKTLLGDISDYAYSQGAESLAVEYDDGELVVYACVGNTAISIASFKRSSKDARELRGNLYDAAKKPANAMVRGRPVKLQVERSESFGEDVFKVTAVSAAPAVRRFTAKQGQYLAFLHHYSKIHRRAPSEAELQEYFRVSPPSVHNMIITLERNGLIERTPGEARSVRVLAPAESLPPLE